MRSSFQSILEYTMPTGNVEDKPPIDRQFDVELANSLAKIESYNKNLYRPNKYLHKWWARRCGSTFRLILKYLVENIEQRDYYVPGGLNGKIILDPMMGGGTTLHEAIRLGANVIGVDIDPIPILQVRASLSDIPLNRLEHDFNNFYTKIRMSLSPLFITSCPVCNKNAEIQFTLYGRLRRCDCREAIFVDNLVLREDKNVISICPICHGVIYSNNHNCLDVGNKLPLMTKEIKVCQKCKKPFREELEKPFYKRFIPLAIVGNCREHGLFFKSPDVGDLQKIDDANSLRNKLDFGPIEDFNVNNGPKSNDLIRCGIKNYLDLFSSRQLLYIKYAMDILPLYKPLVRLNFAMLVSTSLDFNSMLCGYKGGDKKRPGAIRHTFSHHAYSFPYTALENNPINQDRTSGTIKMLYYNGILRGRQWAINPMERRIKSDKIEIVKISGEKDIGKEVMNFEELNSSSHRFMLIQGSAASIKLKSDSIDYIVTDPPYFDSVQYSDLSLYFRVWLKKLIPDGAFWNLDLSESAVEYNGKGNGQYLKVLSNIFSECHRLLRKDDGRLIFTFHHWNPKGWSGLAISLKKSEFILINRYVVHSENPISVHISNLKALTHDAVLVLAPLESGAYKQWELPKKISKEDSYQFCSDCAQALGWVLNNNLAEEEIYSFWNNFFNM